MTSPRCRKKAGFEAAACGRGEVEVGGHLLGDALLVGVVNVRASGVTDGVEAKDTRVFDLLDTIAADHARELEH